MKKLLSFILIFSLFTSWVNAQISNRKAENMVLDNDIKGITQLIANGLDINKTFKENRTLLYMAVAYNKIDVVKLLVEKGANLNIQDSYLNFTPLLRSISKFNRNDSITEYLIHKGADLNIPGIHGASVLRNVTTQYAGYKEQTRLFKLLIEKGADINYKCDECCNASIFLYCCAYGTPEMLQILLDKKVDINQMNAFNLNGLMFALNAKNTANVKFLIQNGINLKHQDKQKQTATDYAISNKCDIIPDGNATYRNKNGFLISDTPYRNGKQNGLYKYYYTNGKIRQSIEYKDGKLCGFWREYYENGQIKEETEYYGDYIVNDTYYTWNSKGEKFMHKGIEIERGGKVGKLHYGSSRSKYIKTKVD